MPQLKGYTVIWEAWCALDADIVGTASWSLNIPTRLVCQGNITKTGLTNSAIEVDPDSSSEMQFVFIFLHRYIFFKRTCSSISKFCFGVAIFHFLPPAGMQTVRSYGLYRVQTIHSLRPRTQNKSSCSPQALEIGIAPSFIKTVVQCLQFPPSSTFNSALLFHLICHVSLK